MKTIISDELLIAELVKHFESGTMGKQYLWELFKDVYKLQRQRFFTIYAEAHTFWAGIKNKALDEAIRENTFKGLEQSYLSKHDAPEDVEYYMCGPGPMAKAVENMLWDLGVPREMLMFDDFGA